MKKTFLIILILFQIKAISQIIYSENFSGLTLQTYTASNGQGSFTYVPTGYNVLNDNHIDTIGTYLNPNTPFNNPILRYEGWLVTTNAIEKDTFLVSTSWLDTTSIIVSRSVITPTIFVPSANTILRWRGMSPDANYRDGYAVYTTTVVSSPTFTDFPLGNRVFALADGNTPGGGETPFWTNRSIDLSPYVGQTLRFAFRNISQDRFQLWIDDIQAVTLPNSRDVAVTSIDATKYVMTNAIDSTAYLKVNFTNNGAALITTLTLNYIVGNSGIESQNFYSTVGWGNLSTNKLVFALPYSVTSPGYYKIKAWVSSINNLPDQNNTNDTASFFITAQSMNVQKNCMLEQFVSANNGDGPDAQYRTEGGSPSGIVVNVHDNDSLKVAAISNLLTDYKVNYSTALIDRNYFEDLNSVVVGKTNYAAKTNTRLASVSPASVSIVNLSYSSASRQMTFTVKADFYGEVVGDYRINAYLTENNVCGNPSDSTVNGYNQLNDYYGVPWSPYYMTGYFSSAVNTYVIDPWHFKHQNVLINAFDGSYGNPGLIPSTGGTSGQSYQQTYTLTLPTSTNGAFIYREDNIYIVGFVAEGSSNKNNRTVLNSVKEKLTANAEIIGVKENGVISNAAFNMYPNPSNGLVYLLLNEMQLNKEMTVSIKDVLGREVYTSKLYSKNTLNEFNLSDLSNGAYLMTLDLNGKKSSRKLIIQH